jgi:hypothetical protein
MKYVTYVLFFTCTYSCRNICGTLDSDSQSRIVKANNILDSNGYVENIPCEYTYLNVHINSSVIDTNIINSIHYVLYDSKNKKGWQVLLIYDNQDKYVFSHHLAGRFYHQTGD